jgi:hypothetical protein
MKDEHKNTWEQVDARWRAQLGEKEEPAPEFNWKQLDDVAARPVVPLWRKVSQSPWVWAAMLALSIGLNWQSVETAQTSLPKIAAMKKKEINFSVSIIALKAPKEAIQIRPANVLLNPSTVFADNPKEEIQVVKSEELPKSIENEEEEIILVRVDIDPIEEKSFTPVTEVAEKPVKRKQNLISQLIRQVIVGEPGGWREIANSNDKLSDGIHQVANTVIRTEQSVKQTLQIQ